MDYAEAVVAVMHVGPTLDQRLGGVLGVVEFSGVDESDHRIGGGVDLGVAVFAQAGVMVRQMIRRLGCYELLRSAASSLARQHCLYFLPLPQGSDHSVRFWPFPRTRREGRTLLYQALLADAKFHEQLLAFDRDLVGAARAAGCPDCGRRAAFGELPPQTARPTGDAR